jgi:hypothetical protein
MKRRGATTGVVMICSAVAAFAIGAGLFAVKNYTRPDTTGEHRPTGPDVTKLKYEQLSKGMDYDDVSKSLGREGTLKSSCTIELKCGRQVETNLYIYENTDGSNCMLVFQDQILRVKTQLGLQ